MATEREKMTAGQPYEQFDPELIARRVAVRKQLRAVNQLDDNDQRNAGYRKLMADSGDDFFVEAGLEYDYGWNIHIGDHFYGNYNMTLLDTCPITIGEHCYFGPNVGLYTPVHPLNAMARVHDVEMGAPITIGDNAWFGGNVTVLPGVTLGNNVVVGAGAVVTKSFGDNVVLVGNPAHVIKEIDNGPTGNTAAKAQWPEKFD
ncbi:sugar O-acetyltransferase [Levilactobacillus brevis]|uniref:Acetyltransferase n=1 Tax=Levilactobacillus hammesii TaxID=267633 RepID=A0A921F395_9LACO|nr:sugar O-acetyltransferase [Levilactobacillus brevis]HJE87260.1 sugar O-acetyltransferase [Levilactobacillus hammesii]